MISYKYEVKGTAADGQTWTADGTIVVQQPGQFPDVPMLALREAFLALTEGRAVYGKPGQGCRGPYRVTGMLIEEKLQ